MIFCAIVYVYDLCSLNCAFFCCFTIPILFWLNHCKLCFLLETLSQPRLSPNHVSQLGLVDLVLLNVHNVHTLRINRSTHAKKLDNNFSNVARAKTLFAQTYIRPGFALSGRLPYTHAQKHSDLIGSALPG